MNRALLSLLIFVGITTILSDCSCTHLCSTAMPIIWFKTFDSSDLTTVKLTWYTKNGQFNQPQGSRTYSSRTQYAPDTLQMYAKKIYLESPNDYDYLVEVPVAGRNWRIAGIRLQQDRIDISTCVSGMVYYLNDTLHKMPMSPVNTDTTSAITLNK